MIKLKAKMHEQSLRYVSKWFCGLDSLCDLTGLIKTDVVAMIKSGCAPGAIYALNEKDEWWSALAAYTGNTIRQPPESARHWYTPAAAWWLRRASLNIRMGHNLSQSAELNEASFIADFNVVFPSTLDAAIAYPDCFHEDRTINFEHVAEAASREWAAWVSGAYGVCLRDFSAHACIRKETLAACIKAQLSMAPGKFPEIRTDLQLIGALHELSSLITPFAPWERPTGTPGVTIDKALTSLALGREDPYSASSIH